MGTIDNFTKYRKGVRIGNWFEDLCKEEDEKQWFIEHRDADDLLIKRARYLFDNFHTRVHLEPHCEYIHFGAIVQLASYMKLCGTTLKADPTLSVTINEKVVRGGELISDICELTVAECGRPSIRSCFKISRYGDPKDGTREPLKYGQTFTIECVEAEENPMLVYSMQKTHGLLTAAVVGHESRKRGKINLPVALIAGKNVGLGKTIPTAYIKWRCYHPNPNKRFDTEGQPIAPNTQVVINHFATNRNLANEPCLIPTFFGPESLVSAQNYPDSRNLWRFVVARDKRKRKI